MESKRLSLDDNPLNARILRIIVDLGNTVLTKRAAGDLYTLVTPGFPLVRAHEFAVSSPKRLRDFGQPGSLEKS